MGDCQRGTETIVAGDLNINLERMGGRVLDKDVAAVVLTAGLEDILENFLPGRLPWC